MKKVIVRDARHVRTYVRSVRCMRRTVSIMTFAVTMTVIMTMNMTMTTMMIIHDDDDDDDKEG